MKLIIGLGNPGNEYVKTRHNIGFMVIDKIAEIFKKHTFNSKLNSLYYELHIQDYKILCIKPQIYMNNSGIAVRNFCKFYKIHPKDVIIIHDDIDLKLGQIKVKIGGGHGGHNGLRSIDQHIGKEYLRIRLGIDKPQYDVANYVLKPFHQIEMLCVQKTIEFVTSNFPLLLKDILTENDISRFLSLYHSI